jgi:hypothetical protein
MWSVRETRTEHGLEKKTGHIERYTMIEVANIAHIHQNIEGNGHPFNEAETSFCLHVEVTTGDNHPARD